MTWLVALLLVARVALALGLGPLLRALAAGQGLALGWERLDLELLQGRLELWRIEAALDGPDDAPREPILSVQSLALDVDVLALLGGHVRVRRLELDGARAELARAADGTWNLDPLLARFAGGTDAEPEPEESEPGPIPLDAPLEILAARVHDLSVHLRDESVEPALDTTLTLSLTAADIGSPERPARLDVVATAPERLDLLRLRGERARDGEGARLALDLELSGLRARPFAHVLAPLGLEPVAERIDGGLALRLHAWPTSADGSSLAATVELEGLRLAEDGREALALDAASLEVQELGPRRLHLKSARLEGLRGRAERLADGALAVGGIALRGTSAKGEAADVGASVAPARSDEPFLFALDALHVGTGRLVFEDRALLPSPTLEARLEEASLEGLSTEAAAPPARFALVAGAPECVRRLELRGSARTRAEAPEVELALDATGIELARLRPWLARAGIEPALEAQGALHLESLRIGPSAEGTNALALRGFACLDGERELLALDSATWRNRADGTPELALDGARLEVLREAGGTTRALGLRFGGAPERPRPALLAEEPPATPPAKAAPTPFEIPRLDLPATRLRFERLRLLDEATGAPPVSLGPLLVTIAPAETSAAGGHALALALEAQADPVRELRAAVRLEQRAAGDLAVSGTARASGMELESLRPWLAALDLEPSLHEGDLEATFALELATEDGHPTLGLELGPLALVEGRGGEAREWLGLERLSVDRLRLDGPLEVERVRIQSPRLALQRDADGGLRFAGLRRMPPPGDAAAEPASDAPPGEQETPSSSPSGFRLGSLELDGARLRFDDLAHPEEGSGAPRVLELGAELRLAGLALGPGAGTTSLEARVTLGSGALSTRGELVLAPDDLRASLQLAAEGWNGEALAPFLPPGLALELRDGSAKAHLEGRLSAAPEGGHALSLRLEDVELREREAETPLATLAALRVEAPRLDPTGAVFDAEELSLEGATLEVRHLADGGLSVLGLHALPSDRAATRAALDPATSDAAADGEGARGDGAAPPAAKSRRAGARPRFAPRLRLGRLDLELAELRVRDEAAPDSAPLRASARLALREPYATDLALAAEGERVPPIGLDLTARLEPGLESLTLGLELEPFAERPRLDATLALRGLEGPDLLALAPGLAPRLDASGLRDGTLDARASAELTWRRRGPLDFDLGAGFGAELSLRELALRPAPEAEIALGVDAVDLLLRNLSPHSGLVHVSRLEVDTPRAHARRTAEGLELGGLLLRPAPPGDGPPTEAPDEAAPARAEAELASAPAGELRIDEFLLHGADLRLEDATTAPASVLPIEELELEVRGFSTRALRAPIPIRVSASLGSGTTALPARLASSSLVRGLASGVLGVVAGSKEEVRYEERPLFQDATLSSRLTLFPAPTGWIRASLTGFELSALRGIAGTSGVEIGDGLLDFTGRLRLDGEEGGHLESLSTFSYLSLSEPDGGPISRYLRLPAPLDTVLFALKNEQGEHRIPLSFDFGQDGGMSTAALTAKVSATLLGLITDALTGAPLRAVGGVTDILVPSGLLGSDKREPKLAGMHANLPFEAGELHLEAGQRGTLRKFVEALEEDPLLELRATHLFGAGDLERAERLASPETHEAAELVRGLRRRRDELARRRDELAAQARAQLLLGQESAFASTRADLTACSRDLGLAEDGLDTVAELLRPDAENRRERRTREAALAIARARLDALSRVLLDAGVPFERLDLRPPRLQGLPEGDADPRGRIELLTRGGTPPKGFFRRILGWIGL